MKKQLLAGLAATGLIFGLAGSASAYTLNTDNGTGFVGKGEVQLALGLNNAQLQTTSVAFTLNEVVVTEVEWVCTNEHNENTQERERTITTSRTAVVSHIARDNKKQITGYNLAGFNGTPQVSFTTAGQPLNSCPNGGTKANWVLSSPAGDPVEVSRTGGLLANGVALG